MSGYKRKSSGEISVAAAERPACNPPGGLADDEILEILLKNTFPGADSDTVSMIITASNGNAISAFKALNKWFDFVQPKSPRGPTPATYSTLPNPSLDTSGGLRGNTSQPPLSWGPITPLPTAIGTTQLQANQAQYARALENRRLVGVNTICAVTSKLDIEAKFRQQPGCQDIVVYWPDLPLSRLGDHHRGFCHVEFRDRPSKDAGLAALLGLRFITNEQTTTHRAVVALDPIDFVIIASTNSSATTPGVATDTPSGQAHTSTSSFPLRTTNGPDIDQNMLDQDSTGQGDTEVVGEDTNMNSEDNDNKRESETGGTERPVWVDDEFNDQMDCTDKDDDW